MFSLSILRIIHKLWTVIGVKFSQHLNLTAKFHFKDACQNSSLQKKAKKSHLVSSLKIQMKKNFKNKNSKKIIKVHKGCNLLNLNHKIHK